MWAWSLYVWRYRLTDGGKTVLLAISCAGMAAAVSLEIPLYHLFLSLMFFYGFSWLASSLFQPRVKVYGSFPEKAMEKVSFQVNFTLENLSRRPAYDVGLGFFGLPGAFRLKDEDVLVPFLPARGRARLQVTVVPGQRGWYQIPDALVYTSFPFHLRRTGEVFHRVGTVTVWPFFHPLRLVSLPLRSRHQPGGLAFGASCGDSPEYIGNREYRPGDPTRRIDFRSWARLARPVVREYQEEYYCRVGLVLDAFVGPRRHRRSFPELEAAVSLTAAVAEATCYGEYVVDLFAAGADIYTFRAGRSIGQFEQILDILACLQGCHQDPLEKILPLLAEELSRMSAVIFIFLQWNQLRRSLVRIAEEAGCLTRVVLIRATRPTEKRMISGQEVIELTPEQVLTGQVEKI